MINTPDMDIIKARMKATWMTEDDYGTFAKSVDPHTLRHSRVWPLPENDAIGA
jgi:hypothetical protein